MKPKYKLTCAKCGKPIKSDYYSIYCDKCRKAVIKNNLNTITMPTSHDIRLIKGRDTMRLKYE